MMSQDWFHCISVFGRTQIQHWGCAQQNKRPPIPIRWQRTCSTSWESLKRTSEIAKSEQYDAAQEKATEKN